MGQDFHYGPRVALRVARLAVEGCHRGELERGFLAWSVASGFLFSSRGASDVFYANNGIIRQARGLDIVDVPGVFFQAMDSAVQVRRWAFSSTYTAGDLYEKAQGFAEAASRKYGKVGVADIFPTDNEKGLLSVSFPLAGSGVHTESVPYVPNSFSDVLTDIISKIQRNLIPKA